MSAGDPHPPLRSYGRTKARTLKPRQAGLLETLLPRIAVPDPAAGPIDPLALKPDASEIWLEIGFGGGEHLAAQAARRPDVLFLGAEPFLNGVASAVRHIDEQRLENVRIHHGDARDLLAALPDVGLARIFILFPDPWPKARHHKRRLIQPQTIAELARVLAPGGSLRFVTDWKDYAAWTLERMLEAPRFHWTAHRADDWRAAPPDHVPTRYEAKRLGDTAPIFLEFERTQAISRRVWVTRARPQADATAERLRVAGHKALVSPVLEIRPLPGGPIDLGGVGALAFTSRNGVEAFARLNTERALPAFAVGEATAQAASEAGFMQVISADGDIAALAPAIARRADFTGMVLHPGAKEPAGDLVALLAELGVEARAQAVYESIETSAVPPPGADAVLIHSPKAARAVARLLQGADLAGLEAFCISAAAADPLRGLNFRRVAVAQFPNEAALLKLL